MAQTGDMSAHSTNYANTFIEVAEDCPVDHGVEPPLKPTPTVAMLHFDLIVSHPYERTSDDVIFETYARRNDIPVEDWEAARERFFAKGQPCLRSSPLGKRYGWGVHHDAEGRVALYPRESEDYARLAADPDLTRTRAMRTRRR